MPHPPLHGTVLVTGASSGIGRALARRLAPVAGRLVLVARRGERLRDLADELRLSHAGLRIEAHPCDLTDAAQLDALVATLDREGGVDVLINDAGAAERVLFERAARADLDRMLALNVVAMVRLTHALVPAMVARGRGGVLNVGSTLGVHALPGMATYVGTKHFVRGFSRSLRAELGPAGVVVTEASPGPVETELFEVGRNEIGLRPSRMLQLEPDICAGEILAAFRRGRAVVYPGRLLRWTMLASFLLPRPVVQWAIEAYGARLRRQARLPRSPA